MWAVAALGEQRTATATSYTVHTCDRTRKWVAERTSTRRASTVGHGASACQWARGPGGDSEACAQPRPTRPIGKSHTTHSAHIPCRADRIGRTASRAQWRSTAWPGGHLASPAHSKAVAARTVGAQGEERMAAAHHLQATHATERETRSLRGLRPTGQLTQLHLATLWAECQWG